MESVFQPMFDRDYATAAAEWRREFEEFYAKKENIEHGQEFWEWSGSPPDREYYVNYTPEQATWFCLYETVSEGSPVSPPFETKQELANYLAEHGDFWDQSRRKDGTTSMDCSPWGKEAAEKFVFGGGYMPSMVITGGEILTGGKLAAEMNKCQPTS